MLRSILALAVVCCAAVPAARAENWMPVTNDRSGDYVDVDSIRLSKIDGMVFAEFKRQGNLPVQVVFDCRAARVFIPAIAAEWRPLAAHLVPDRAAVCIGLWGLSSR